MSQVETQTSSTPSVEPDDLKNVSRGDVFVIEGERYPVFRLNSGLRSLFTPDHPEVVTPNGDVKGLAHGIHPDAEDGATVLCFREDVCSRGDNPPLSDCLTVGLENVELQQGGESDILSLLPSTSSRGCPECGNEGVYQFGDRDGNHTREARRCGDCEPDTYYVVDREIPETTTKVRSRTHEGEWGDPVELSGVYRQVITSRFQMDPRQRAREGFYSAKEVAEFINAKMNSDGEAEQFGYVTVNDTPRTPSVTWRDDWIDRKMEVTFEPVR